MRALRVAIVGAGGRMGRFARELLAGRDEFEVAASVGRGDDLRAALRAAAPDVALDLTAAGLGARHGRAMLECGVRCVIGTSGVQPREACELDALARELGLGGLIVPNFSLGIWLQQRLALEAARYLSSVEILEEHHIGKKDAPSGTAAHTARLLGEALGRPAEAIPIHSVRLAGLYSNQSVMFGGAGEVLTLTHRTYGNAAFGPGILASLRYARSAEGVEVGIGVAFQSRARE